MAKVAAMHAPPVGDETDPNGAKRLVSEAELSAEGAAHLEKAKKPKLSDAAQARYQQLLARLLVRALCLPERR